MTWFIRDLRAQSQRDLRSVCLGNKVIRIVQKIKIFIFYLWLSDHNVCGQGSLGFSEPIASTKYHVRRIGNRFTENVKAMSHSPHSGVIVQLWKTVVIYYEEFLWSIQVHFFSIQGIDFLECFRKNLHQLFWFWYSLWQVLFLNLQNTYIYHWILSLLLFIRLACVS